jgi:hypothetical protein
MLTTTPRPENGSQQNTVERIPKMPRFGVAFFDNELELTGGWASLAGGPAFRFRQPLDLPSDSVWVTSASKSYAQTALSSMHNMRPSYFFPSNLTHIAKDLGMAVEGDDWARLAAAPISEIVNRAVMIAAQVYKWQEPIQHLKSEMLQEDIRVSLPTPPNPVQGMAPALLSALQMSSLVPTPWENDSIIVALRMNRLAYAKKILSTPIPDGVWNYASIEDTPNFSYSIEKACDGNYPCLVEATVETGKYSREMAELSAFGVTGGAAGAKRHSLRSWISQPELQWLSKHANIKISRVYWTTGSRPLIERYQLPEMMCADDLWELSIAAGLVAEAHWRALAKDTYQKNLPGKKSATAMAVWLRAADRSMCFDLARRAFTAGFPVTGYGNGSVTVKIPRQKLDPLLEFAMDNGVAHPAFREILHRNGFC